MVTGSVVSSSPVSSSSPSVPSSVSSTSSWASPPETVDVVRLKRALTKRVEGSVMVLLLISV